jgi:glycosyltransferase involved in cell wall biosynthesis
VIAGPFRTIAWALHDRLRDSLWVHGHLVRKWRAARTNVAAVRGGVLHVTTSFDVGGTQTQIRHLLTSATTHFQHRATEMFPELNYLFRRDIVVADERYVRGGPLARLVGRAIVNRSRRGSHLVQVAKLVRDIRAENPEIVVAWGHEMCVTTFLAAAIARVPHIVFCVRTFNPTYGWAEPQFGRLLLEAHRRMAPNVSRVIVNSTLLRDDYVDWAGIEPARIAVCANGLQVDERASTDTMAARMRTRAALGIADDAIVISNVGRFSPEKGQRTLIDANRRLVDHGITRRVVWVLCGDGPTLADVKAAAGAMRMDNVVFTGRSTAVRDILAASDIFVMPSDFEGMPNAMMEAMAAGLPCVSTSCSGARDIARDGLEALYYNVGDTATLVSHLCELIEHPDRARALGTAARARIEQFDVSRFVKCFEAVLADLRAAS